jgi:hypothetical protein
VSSVDTFVRTRASLHAVAEHVVAAALFRTTKKIGLRATSGGFGTPTFGADEQQVRVDGTTLVHAVGGRETRHALTTLRAAAEAIGIEPGAPPVYTAQTQLDLDRPLDLDPAAARVIGWWFELGAAALARLRADAESNPAGADAPSVAQLWPEHFDLATDLGAPTSRANFGASPGDAEHSEPYLYVGPWGTKPSDAFWNEAFGASLLYATLREAEDAHATALAFFRRGRELLAAGARDFSS